MKTDKAIDVETIDPPSQALARIQSGALSYALPLEEIHRSLEYVRKVMAQEMREGQDYGKIPGAGDRPTLLQPGAQKLLMTFNLTEFIKKEVLREYQNFHREYEFTVCVKAVNGKEWDGVGTCSTLEAKYRYRKAARKCPKCGSEAIIKGKREYGGGWLCFDKKGGCGAKYPDSDKAITSQDGSRVEHDNPADYWNTCRKMAFKRALVAAAINATNTSDLWTQDLEEMGRSTPEEDAGYIPPEEKEPPQAPPPQKAPEPAQHRDATDKTRVWMIAQIDSKPDLHRVATEFFQKLGAILPTEDLIDLPLPWVATNKEELGKLFGALGNFEVGDAAAMPYFHEGMPKAIQSAQVAAWEASVKADPPKPVEVPRGTTVKDSDDPNSPDAAWRSFEMPFGKDKGTPLAELPKNTLFGWFANYEVETEYNGRPKKPEQIEKDQEFRRMLDMAGEHYQFEVKS